MARIETDPNYTAPTFPRATAATDLFKKEDVQNLAAAISTHDHSTGKGVAIPFTSIPAGTITSGMIADATIVATDIADGAITSAKIADGTIATVDIANAAVTNAKLGPDTARVNLLANGGFEIWQRGTGPFTLNGAYCADRWLYSIGPGGTISVIADATNNDTASRVCAAVTYTHGGNLTLLYQPFASQGDLPGLVQQLRGKQVTFSMRVKTSTAGAVSIGVYGTAHGRATGTPHTGNGTYQTLTYSTTVPVNETSFQVEVSFSASCTAYVDNAMLVVGSQSADYAPLHPADDLARCLR